MMASSREERLQMRQRGAGTRKIKDVNFGFSFGSPVDPTTRQQDFQTIAEVAGSTDSAHEPVASAQPVTRPTPNKISTGLRNDGTPRGTSRNKLPERPSTFDIPLSDEAEHGRSSKRRRIGISRLPTESPVPPLAAGIEERYPLLEPPITNDGDTIGEATIAPNDDVPLEINGNHVQDKSADRASVPGQTGEDKVADSETAPTNGRRERNGETELNSDNIFHNRRSKRNSGLRDPPNEDPSTETAARREKEAFGPSTAADQRERVDQDQGSTLSLSTHSKKLDKKTKTGRENAQNETSEKEEPATKRRPGRRKANPPNTSQEQIPETTRSRPVSATEKNRERGDDRRSKQPSRKSKEKVSELSTRSRGRLSVKAAQEEPTPLPTDNQPPPTAAEPERPPKRRRGRPSAAIHETAKTRQRDQESAPDQGEENEGATGERKKGRGETVPITIHRLANVAALDSRTADDSDGASSDEQASGDDEQSLRKKNFPQRGGVNPADVLSQICSETIEKTLARLKIGIENESNQTRRSEWTRKRKAVEAYGAELEGRLFEMSEMLDSNFVLGVKLKKAKREMTDMRNRLLEVRQRRQEVALRMDEVRRKHSAEEEMKMSRNTINNSLHNLDLALDRNRVRNNDNAEETDRDENSLPAAPAALAGLEFLLRTVSESVSSNAPGSQGGLLNQVKAFNTQLEMAAKRLES